jgi:hypothetical protein
LKKALHCKHLRNFELRRKLSQRQDLVRFAPTGCVSARDRSKTPR